MSAPTLVVMAAGIGSRYGGLKQVDPVGPSGEILIEYSLYDAVRAGFGRVVFVITRQIEPVFRERIGSKAERAVEVRYAFQELSDVPAGYAVPAGRTKPWGTGHAALAARHEV
ncbi:nucleotidyltransferase, partial [bacterium]|nr:nucleotidyltransferase [bacterium]